MGDLGRELHPGDKQPAPGVEEVQILAAEFAGSVKPDPTEDNAEVGRVKKFNCWHVISTPIT